MSTRRLPDDAFSVEFPAAMGRPANAALVSLGVTTLAQVAAMTKRELLAVHGVGPKAIVVLEAELQKHGLELAG
jgi:hypothetical protein